MIPGEDITSLPISLQLKEMGLPQDKTLCYASGDHARTYISTLIEPVDPNETWLCAAYTQSDLRPYLPDHIANKGKTYLLTIPQTVSDDFFVGYRQKDSNEMQYRFEGYSADTYAKLVLSLFNDGKIALPVIT